jgi:glycosyltransferase involved in cell wall biosynthesis
MLSKGALGLKSFKKKLFLLISKLTGLYQGVVFHATQPQEEKEIRSHFGKNKIFVVPNLNAAKIVLDPRPKIEGQLNLFYLSRVSRVKNLRFALECLMNVSDNFKVNYNIYGNIEDGEYWQQCQELIKTLPPHISISYKGELEFDKVQNVISGEHCLFLPTLNENYGHSIVESLLSGCPVIISDQTPWNEINEAGAGKAGGLNDKDFFVKAIEYYSKMNEIDFNRKRVLAAEFMAGKIDIENIKNKYIDLFNECI